MKVEINDIETNPEYRRWVGEKKEAYPDINMIKNYYETHSLEMLNEILRRFQRLIIKILNDNSTLWEKNPRVSKEDLIQELNLAIVETLNEEVYKIKDGGVQPSTYFYGVCYSHILIYLEKNSDSIFTHKNLADIKKEKIIKEFGDSDEVLKKHGIKKKNLSRWLPKTIKSFTDKPSEDSKHTYEELIPDGRLNPEQELYQRQKEEMVDNILRENLKEEEYNIVRDYMDENSKRKIPINIRTKLSKIDKLRKLFEEG